MILKTKEESETDKRNYQHDTKVDNKQLSDSKCVIVLVVGGALNQLLI